MTKDEATAAGLDWREPWWLADPAAYEAAKKAQAAAAKAESSRAAASAAPVAPIAKADSWAKVIADLNSRDRDPNRG